MAVSLSHVSLQSPPAPIRGGPLALVASEDGRLVALTRRSASRGAATFVYDASTGKPLLEARVLSLLPTGRRALVTVPGRATEIADFDRNTYTPIKGARNAMRPIGDRFAFSFGDDDSLVSWNLATLKQQASIARPPTRFPVPGAHAPSFADIVPLPDGKTLAWLDAKFALHIFDLEAGTVRAMIPGGPRELPRALLRTRDGTRALAIGTKGSCVWFDLIAMNVASRTNDVPGIQGPLALMDDGRLAVESRFVDLVDVATGKRATIGTRDPSRETIHAIVALRGAFVAVLVDRMTTPKEPVLTDRFIEIYDVSSAKKVASIAAEACVAPMVFIDSAARLLCAVEGEGPSEETSWQLFEIEGLESPAPRAESVSTKPAAKKPAAKKTAARKPRSR